MQPHLRRTPPFLPILLLFLLLPALSAAAEDDVLRATLANGLRVAIVRNALAPVATVEIGYRVGSAESPPGFPGTAHAMEHMMFRGSPGLSAAQFSTIVAAMGGEFNAATQPTATRYFITVPKESLDIALNIEAARMRGILSTEKLWRQERGAIEQEVAQDLSDPQYLFYERLLAHLFAGTPYAHSALGTRPSFRRTTGAMLRRFHRTWYGPNNAVLVIVGDLDPPDALAQVRRIFGPIPPRPTGKRPPVRLSPPKPATVALDTNLPYGLAVAAWRMPGYDHPDYAAGLVLADVLASRRGNLYALVPDGEALDADFEASAFPKAGMGYATAAFPPGGNGPALAARLKGIVAGYVRNGVPAGLVEAAKRRTVAHHEFRRNSVPGLASLWSDALAVEGRDSPGEEVAAVRAVTVGDVDRVAREWLSGDAAVTAVLTPRPSGAPVSSGKFGGVESFAPKRTKAVRVPGWARKAVSLPTIPATGVHPTDIRLPNGLRLLLQQETISDTVTVVGRVKENADMEAPPGKEGVDRLLETLFEYGTRTLPRLAFREAVDDIAADLTVGTSFSLEVPGAHFERGMQLLAENLLAPALPEDAFAIVRRETRNAVAGEIASPGYLTRRAIRAGLYPEGDPSLRQATPATVEALTLEDVRAYHRKAFRPDLTTIVVIGNVTPERAREVAERYFGPWKAEGERPETDLPPVPPNGPSAAVVPDRSRVQPEVTLAQTVGITRRHPDYYALDLGNHVLSGSFYATRLYRDLREQAGLVYSVESALNAGRTRTSFAVFFASDPTGVSRARALVERNLVAMQETPVTPAELRQAKTLLIRRIPLDEASVDGIAARLIHFATEDLPMDEPVRAARRYLDLTAEEVRAAFRKWIRPSGFVEVVRGPAPR